RRESLAWLHSWRHGPSSRPVVAVPSSVGRWPSTGRALETLWAGPPRWTGDVAMASTISIRSERPDGMERGLSPRPGDPDRNSDRGGAVGGRAPPGRVGAGQARRPPRGRRRARPRRAGPAGAGAHPRGHARGAESRSTAAGPSATGPTRASHAIPAAQRSI